MRNGIYMVTSEQLQYIMPMDEAATRVVKLSRYLFVGYYGDSLMCVMGLVPSTLLSDRAYLWLISSEDVGNHKVVFGRAAHKFIKTILGTYSTVIGHCESRSVKWLKCLGAEIGPVQNDFFPFRITR